MPGEGEKQTGSIVIPFKRNAHTGMSGVFVPLDGGQEPMVPGGVLLQEYGMHIMEVAAGITSTVAVWRNALLLAKQSPRSGGACEAPADISWRA